MKKLKDLENKSIFIIREAFNKYKKPAILWSVGKDSTLLLWLAKKAFYNKIPFPIIHIDTGYKFKKIYEFRDGYAKELNFNLIITKNKNAKETPEKDKFECCNARKTEALKQIIKENGFDALFVGIRRDEHGIRNKERYFSPRDKKFKWNVSKKDKHKIKSLQDAEFSGWNIFATDFGPNTNHVRIHPLLHWTELDVWEYIQQEQIPVVKLYFTQKGKRFRSIGCEPCCKPVNSSAKNVNEIIEELKTTKIEERSGREQDKEYNMQKLRSLGYM